MKTMIDLKHPGTDILSGIIIALVSIPISMGYAQIAGLPAVYGLYGSFLPVLIFSLLTSSPQFVIGVDAMPAVMIGSMLTDLGIAAFSEEAMAAVPVVSLLCGLWFLVFRLLKAGRVVKYISNPVMGGFISGIGMTIILMQVPKLFGGSAGIGELIPLVQHIAAELPNFHPLSAALGIGSIAVILIAKKLKPGFPMSVVVMVMGILLIAVFHLDDYGVKTLSAAQSGLPRLVLPKVAVLLEDPRKYLTVSLTIALVIMAQSLLATGSYAAKNGYSVNQNRELVAYAAMNFAGCAVGCCPINGSVSRTGMTDGLGTKSQLSGITAAVVMVLILLFGTGLLSYMPVPVLTGIVTTALIGIIDTSMAKRLWKVDHMEFFIFLGAFFGVLLLGTIYGVVIGVVLSFFDVIRIAVVPPRCYMGMISGQSDFYDLSRTRNARPVEGILIYRFSGNLFFANFSTLQADLDEAMNPEIHTVIIDGRGISDIDITAADNLLRLYDSLKRRGIRLYLTEHGGSVNDALRRYGAGSLIDEGAVRRTIELALSACGLTPPYPLAEGAALPQYSANSEQLAEFEWLFGEDMEEKLQEAAAEIAESLVAEDAADQSALDAAERHSHWGKLGTADEDELLSHIELRLEKLAEEGLFDQERLAALEALLEERAAQLDSRLKQLDPELLERIRSHRQTLHAHAKEINPALYQKHLALQQRLQEHLDAQKEANPVLHQKQLELHERLQERLDAQKELLEQLRSKRDS